MAKSLVTVTVENVYRNFLIDEERYELLDVVKTMQDVFFNEDVLIVPPIRNERIKSFLEGVIENFALGATSMLRTYAVDTYPESIPSVVFDRARRAAASMNRFDAEYDVDESPRHNVQMWMWCLWANFTDAFYQEHVKTETKHGTLPFGYVQRFTRSSTI
jgi:methionyl-tRNA synthetase